MAAALWYPYRALPRDRVIRYGHGGAGVTLSWGSAAEAARIVARLA